MRTGQHGLVVSLGLFMDLLSPIGIRNINRSLTKRLLQQTTFSRVFPATPIWFHTGTLTPLLIQPSPISHGIHPLPLFSQVLFSNYHNTHPHLMLEIVFWQEQKQSLINYQVQPIWSMAIKTTNYLPCSRTEHKDLTQKLSMMLHCLMVITIWRKLSYVLLNVSQVVVVALITSLIF